jgi:site-specific DNA-methyltransferase (adenine-specific)
MLGDSRIKKIVDYVDSSECFRGVDIAGGISYFLWDAKYNGKCDVTSVRGNDIVTMERKLDEYDIFIRNNVSKQLLQRITESPDKKMDEYVLSRNVFGIPTSEHGQEIKDETHSLILACSQKGNQLRLCLLQRKSFEESGVLGK